MPFPKLFRQIRGRTVEGESVQFGGRVMPGTAGLLQHRERTEARVLAAGRPRQISQRLDSVMTGNQIDPVANFEPAHQRQDLVGRQIKGVQHQPQLLMLDQRKEPKSAVSCPLHEYCIGSPAYHGFHVAGAFVNGSQLIAVALKQSAVGPPGRIQRFERIVKEIDVTGDSPASGQEVQRHPSGHVGLSLREAVGRYEAADGLLESGDSH